MNLVEQTVLSMGCAWHPTTPLEVGIDGHIELVDPHTGQALNVWIPVQIKARTNFVNDSETTFEFVCDERDLDYWLRANAKVILIVCKPISNEAYFVSIRDYFKVNGKDNNRRIRFDKNRDRFDDTRFNDLLNLGAHRDSGTYLAPLPRPEHLITNLLEVSFVSPQVHVAETTISSPKEVWEELNRGGGHWNSDWLLKSGRIWSFRELSPQRWGKILDLGTTETLPTNDWVSSDPPASERDFVQLLNLCLKTKIGSSLNFDRQQGYFYYPAPEPLRSYKRHYRYGHRQSNLTVVHPYSSQSDASKLAYVRHMGFRPQFRRIDDTWYLEITPTYHFTRDGHIPDLFSQEHIRKIKRFERQMRVLSQTRMWADFLTAPPQFHQQTYPFLSFGSLLTLEAPVGIDDKLWSLHDDDSQEPSLAKEIEQLGLL